VSATDADSASTWQALLGIEVLTRMATTVVTPDAREIEIEGLLRGLSLTVSRFGWSWVLSTTQAPDRGGEFTLDSETDGVLAPFTGFQVQVLSGWYQWLATSTGLAPGASTLTFNNLSSGSSVGTLREYLAITLGWSIQEAIRFDSELCEVYSAEFDRLISSVVNSLDYPELAAF
jgi:hypothetical protein